MKHPLGENLEQAPMTRRRVPQPSRQVIPPGSESSNAETLADQIAAFEGALRADQLAKFLSISAISLLQDGQVRPHSVSADRRIRALLPGHGSSLAAAAWRIVS